MNVEQAPLLRRLAGLLGEAAEVLVAEEAVGEGDLGGGEDDLSGVFADERERSLDEAQGADAALLVGGLGPLLERRPDPLAAPKQICQESALAGGRLLRATRSAGVLTWT